VNFFLTLRNFLSASYLCEVFLLAFALKSFIWNIKLSWAVKDACCSFPSKRQTSFVESSSKLNVASSASPEIKAYP